MPTGERGANSQAISTSIEDTATAVQNPREANGVTVEQRRVARIGKTCEAKPTKQHFLQSARLREEQKQKMALLAEQYEASIAAMTTNQTVTLDATQVNCSSKANIIEHSFVGGGEQETARATDQRVGDVDGVPESAAASSKRDYRQRSAKATRQSRAATTHARH